MYEILGTFNKWGNNGDFSFNKSVSIRLEAGSRWKIHDVDGGNSSYAWHGWDDMESDLDGCFASCPDGYGGLNIETLIAGDYKITFENGVITVKEIKIMYEILGTFNCWGGGDNLTPYRFEKSISIYLEAGSRWKIHNIGGGNASYAWHGWEDMASDLDGCFASCPDGYGGLNIETLKDGDYEITFENGVITVK